MNKSFDLLSLGEVLLRLSPPSNERLVRGETLQKQVGGAELNVVSGVSLLGLRTGIISKLPANDIGTYAKNRIRFCGVSDDHLVYDNSPEARLGIYYYENGAYPRKPGVVYDRRHSTINTISVDDFDETLFSSTRCFHTSGITLALSEQCRSTAMEMIRRFKEAGALISFDVNFRGNLWTRTDPSLRRYLLLLRGDGKAHLPQDRGRKRDHEKFHRGLSDLYRRFHPTHRTQPESAYLWLHHLRRAQRQVL